MSGGGRIWTTRAMPTCSVLTARVASSPIATRTKANDCETHCAAQKTSVQKGIDDVSRVSGAGSRDGVRDAPGAIEHGRDHRLEAVGHIWVILGPGSDYAAGEG